MSDNEIAGAIQEWAIRNARRANRWTQTAIGRAIKQVVYQFGNWRNKERGNPKKGFRVMKEKMEEIR